MATKSISKNIIIKDGRLASGLISALEYASEKPMKKVILQRRLNEVKREDVKRYFEA